MSEKELLALRLQLAELDRKIKPLEWDASRNQINEFKKVQLTKLQAQRSELMAQIQQ